MLTTHFHSSYKYPRHDTNTTDERLQPQLNQHYKERKKMIMTQKPFIEYRNSEKHVNSQIKGLGYENKFYA